MQRAGRSVEFGREVVRDNPLGINEAATGEAQLWVLMSQVRRELELAPKAEVLVTDRGVVDNFAYYLRAAGGDPFSVEPLIRAWSRTYDLVVRLTPDVALRADGTRSTNDTFRDEVEAILDRIMPDLLRPEQLVTMPASTHHRRLRLVAARGAPRGVRRGSRCWPPGVERPRRPRPRGARPAAPAAPPTCRRTRSSTWTCRDGGLSLGSRLDSGR